MDIEKVREDIPILKRKVYGKPLVYLDSAATSQKPRCVIDALKNYYEMENANVHRGIHALSEIATEKYEKARDKVAGFINAKDRESVIFVKNATEAINLVARSWGVKNIREGDEILLTQMEHHSNLVPWQMIAKQTGAELKFIGIKPDGTLNLEGIETLITPLTKIVGVTQVSNVLGTINPVEEITEIAHQKGALVLVDGAQSVPHMPVDVQRIDCDFMAFSGHKMMGPTGVGVLYGKRELLEEMDPFLGGGEMIREVRWDSSTWNDLPWKFEAGTPNIAQAIGLGVAVDYLQSLCMEKIREHERQLLEYALQQIGSLDGAEIYGPRDERGGVVSFNLEGIHPHDLSTILDQEGIAIRAGHHCAMPLMRRLGVSATVRASLYIYNNQWDVDVLVEGLKTAKELLTRVPA